jgi:hypothetical protein
MAKATSSRPLRPWPGCIDRTSGEGLRGGLTGSPTVSGTNSTRFVGRAGHLAWQYSPDASRHRIWAAVPGPGPRRVVGARSLDGHARWEGTPAYARAGIADRGSQCDVLEGRFRPVREYRTKRPGRTAGSGRRSMGPRAAMQGLPYWPRAILPAQPPDPDRPRTDWDETGNVPLDTSLRTCDLGRQAAPRDGSKRPGHS